MSDYYVYVYIDPRNYEEFYYGKGRGSRKDAHLSDNSESRKARRIAEIRSVGSEPIIRVIARDLTEQEALWVEATLLWKLRKFTTNAVAGHFSDHFRPPNTFHRDLPGFDFQNRLYYFNVGECHRRNWDECRRYGFISAGGGVRWRDAILGFNVGDVFAAYLKGHGYVGIGRILEKPKPASHIVIGGKPLIALCPQMAIDSDSADNSEYVAIVDWISSFPREAAKMKRKSGLYTTTHVRAALDGQPDTVDFLSNEFDVNFNDILA
jgi:hypothetical protein